MKRTRTLEPGQLPHLIDPLHPAGVGGAGNLVQSCQAVGTGGRSGGQSVSVGGVWGRRCETFSVSGRWSPVVVVVVAVAAMAALSCVPPQRTGG